MKSCFFFHKWETSKPAALDSVTDRRCGKCGKTQYKKTASVLSPGCTRAMDVYWWVNERPVK